MKDQSSRNHKPRPTQKDIASGLNVSLITVQRALKKSGYVSKKMQQRIEDYARKIGYQPDRAAQSLVRKSMRRLAVFSTEAPEFYWDDVEKGVNAASSQISDFGFQVLYIRIPAGDTDFYLEELRNQKVRGLDGAILVNNLEYEMKKIFQCLDEFKIPYGTLNIDAPTSERKAFVGVDHSAEGRLAAEYLNGYCRGKDSMLMISSEPLRSTAIEGADIALERWSGFSETAKAFSIKSVKHMVQGNDIPKHILRNVGGIYLTALNKNLVEAIREKASCPIITGINSPENRKMLKKGIIQAIVCQNPVLQGYYAVKVMESLLEGESSEPIMIKLVHSLLLRENIDYTRNHLLLIN